MMQYFCDSNGLAEIRSVALARQVLPLFRTIHLGGLLTNVHVASAPCVEKAEMYEKGSKWNS